MELRKLAGHDALSDLRERGWVEEPDVLWVRQLDQIEFGKATQGPRQRLAGQVEVAGQVLLQNR